MLDVKVGDVVTGYGWRHDKECTLYVEKINFYPGTNEIMSVSGKVVSESDRLTQINEFIGRCNAHPEKNVHAGPHSVSVFDGMGYGPILKHGGWVIIDGYEIAGDPVSLSEKIRKLEIGESIEIKRDDHPINSCRTSASLLGDKYGRKFRVSKTEAGCTIGRTE